MVTQWVTSYITTRGIMVIMSQTFHDIVHTSFGLNFWISKKYFNEVPVDEFGWKTKEFSNRFNACHDTMQGVGEGKQSQGHGMLSATLHRWSLSTFNFQSIATRNRLDFFLTKKYYSIFFCHKYYYWLKILNNLNPCL